MADVTVLALVGSLRAASLNRQLAELAAETAPDDIAVSTYEGVGGGLGELPYYNEDIDNPADVPASVTTLRDAVAEADAILVAHLGHVP